MVDLALVPAVSSMLTLYNCCTELDSPAADSKRSIPSASTFDDEQKGTGARSLVFLDASA